MFPLILERFLLSLERFLLTIRQDSLGLKPPLQRIDLRLEQRCTSMLVILIVILCAAAVIVVLVLRLVGVFLLPVSDGSHRIVFFVALHHWTRHVLGL